MTQKTISETDKSEGKLDQPLSARLLTRIFSTLGRYKWMVLAGNAAVFICVAADLLVIDEVRKIIDRDDLMTESIFVIIAPVLVLCILHRVFGFTQWIVTLYATNKAMENFRKDFFAKLLSFSKSFYDIHKAGWLVARSTGDMAVIWEFMTFSMMMLVICLTAVGMALFKISAIEPVLLLPCIITVPIVLVTTVWYKRRMTRTQRMAREQNSRLVANMSENIRGIKVVQAFSREEHNLASFNELNLISHDTEIQVERLNSLYLPSMDFIGLLNTSIVVTFSSLMFQAPSAALATASLTTGDLVSYILYMNVIIWPVRMLVEIYSLAIRAMAAAERIYEIMDLPPAVMNSPSPVTARDIRGDIKFENVSFRYTDDKPFIITGMNIHVTPGETLAIVGRTGAGKTTMASLIARFYDVTSGRVLIDDTDVRDYDIDTLHRNMGVVLQDGFLFSGSVMDNLRFRQPDMPEDAVIQTARLLNTHTAFLALKNGYDTIIQEGGASISEGQRQLISITRALIADPRILILDEPTSSLDIHTETLIQNALETLMRGRTTIVIAHRLSTVRHADRIIVLSDGRIIESGTHDELAVSDGGYSQLLRINDGKGPPVFQPVF